MGVTITTSKVGGGGDAVEEVQRFKYATGQVFKKGAPVIDDAAGEVVECGADPQSILGVALQGAGTGPGYGVANEADVVVATGRSQEVSVAMANRRTRFKTRGVNGGTDPVLPLQTHIGEQYSLAKVGNDWVIDLANAATPAIEITDIFPDDGLNLFEFKFLESVLARP
jgi:hypothetical protein